MKRKITLPIISGLAIIALSASTVVSSGGIANWTGSPVDGGLSQGTCGASGCHSGGATTPSLSLTAFPAFDTGNTYTPSQTYTITITPSGSYPRYGMNCEIINSQATAVATYPFGLFGAAVTTNCQIYTTSQTGGYPACVSHNSSSTTLPFQFTWTAPASGTGYLYCVVNGVNNSGTVLGDHVSAVTSLTLTPASVGIAFHNETTYKLNVYPNPANDNIRVAYTLSERSHVSVKLCSMNGDIVADLLNENQDRGTRSVDAHLPIGLAKGMYIVKLNVNGKQALEKLIVL